MKTQLTFFGSGKEHARFGSGKEHASLALAHPLHARLTDWHGFCTGGPPHFGTVLASGKLARFLRAGWLARSLHGGRWHASCKTFDRLKGVSNATLEAKKTCTKNMENILHIRAGSEYVVGLSGLAYDGL